MISTEELLRSYLEGIRHLSGARSASLFVPGSYGGLAGPLLIHVGDLPPCQELSELESAIAWSETAAKRVSESEPPATGLQAVLPSKSPHTSLLPLPAVSSVWSPALLQKQLQGTPTEPRRRRGDRESRAPVSEAWLALRFVSSDGHEGCFQHTDPWRTAAVDASSRWRWLFLLGGALVSHSSHMAAVVRDPVTGLLGRVGLLATLSEALERARLEQEPLSLLLINPDDFSAVDERLGRVNGDRIVLEIAARIRETLRSTDLVFRYGGVVFGVMLLGTALSEAHVVGEKLLSELSGSEYLDGAVPLDFSAGLALADPAAPESGASLIRRADRALNAVKRRGGGALIDSATASELEEKGNFDRLDGVFTGHLGDDYRHMVLLWDFVEVLSTSSGFEDLASAVLEKLQSVFRPDRLALCSCDSDHPSLEPVAGLCRSDSGAREPMDPSSLTAGERRLMERALAAQELFNETVQDDGDGEASVLLIAAPLLLGERRIGCLLFVGREEEIRLQESEQKFLAALAPQLALALDRARLADLESRRLEHEKARLRASLGDLRDAIREAKLLYRSRQMEAVVDIARRAAPTDATVLITGPSGTGKELMARTVRQLSARRGAPFVVVDCSAIAKTLIERELFGHERGAYTGAEGRRAGRLAEADGGTLFLDEVGELPLEVQAKLLRFVQEKQFSRVGGTAIERIDARIVAATNRDLVSEVVAGRFREDLFYRLNVVNLKLPALRDRPDDILLLAQHFLSGLTLRYHKEILGFTPAAEGCLLECSWPGNVRELQNRIVKAVVLCERDLIGVADLGFEEGGVPRLDRWARAQEESTASTAAGSVARGPLRDLRDVLGPIVGEHRGGKETPPLGRWLEGELIMAASRRASGLRQAAVTVGLPRTTYRRRLRKAEQDTPCETPPGWRPIREILAKLIETEGGEEAALLGQVRGVLLDEIRNRGLDTRTGAALLGVSAPTYRRRLAELAESP